MSYKLAFSIKNVPFVALFSGFGHKVTKKYLYLHLKSVLIKVKSEKGAAKKPEIAVSWLRLLNADCKFTLNIKH